MELKIISYKKIILFQKKISSLIAPGKNGIFQILKNHDSFISILKKGYLKFEKKNIKEKIKIEGGILRVKKNLIIILI